MTTLVRSLVSKKKRRFNEDGYDLDLTYITDNIIAMGYPAENMEGMYRNNMADVIRFFDARHGDHYKVYNLCSERCYDKSKFHGRVAHYPFEDHNAPPIELMQPFCEDVHDWLCSDTKNVAVVHCKAGKGRTGVMISAYLLHAGMWKTPQQALEFYGAARTKNAKGVTIPSQSRYVGYYGQLINGKIYEPITLLLTKFRIHTFPKPLKEGGSNVMVDVKMKNIRVYASSTKTDTISRLQNSIEIQPTKSIPLCGDVKIDFYVKTALSKEKLCHFWFNTCFVPTHDNILTLTKSEIDKAHKDKTCKIFDTEFKIDLLFSNLESGLKTSRITASPSTATNTINRLHGENSGSNLSVGTTGIQSEEEDSFENDVGEEELEEEEEEVGDSVLAVTNGKDVKLS